MSIPITNESTRLAASDYETWRANQAANEQKRLAQLVAALRALPKGCLDCEITELIEAHMVASLPDIGPDPLKSDLPRDIASARKRLQSGLDRQQFGVPDQTALVWRGDISTVLCELTWRTAQAEGLKALREKQDHTCQTINKLDHCCHCGKPLKPPGESSTIGSALYHKAITECLPEHRELQVKVWSPTPWMVDVFVGSEERRRLIRNWCNHNYGRESLPIHDISGNWHEGGVTINGKTWYGFKTQAMMDAVMAQFPPPSE